jgi:hypothetical protein
MPYLVELNSTGQVLAVRRFVESGELGNPLFAVSNPFQRKSLFDYENPLAKLKTANKTNVNVNRITGKASIKGTKTPYKAEMFFTVKNGKVTPIKNATANTQTNTQTRRVTIEGSMNLESYIKAVLDVQNDVKDDFIKDNWQLVSFQFIKAGGGEYSLTPLTFRITADVSRQFSLSQIQDRALTLLQKYQTISGSHLSNISVRASESETVYTGITKNDRSTSDTKGSNGNNNSKNDSGNTSSFSLFGGDALSNFGTALGLSTPVMAVVGGLLVYVAIKR